MKKGDKIDPECVASGDVCDRIFLFRMKDGTSFSALADGGTGETITVHGQDKLHIELKDIEELIYDDDQPW